MHGLCDAPRAWHIFGSSGTHLEHRQCLQTSTGACLFLVIDRAEKSQLTPLQDDACDAPGKLVAMFGIHVDYLLGCRDTTNDVYQKVMSLSASQTAVLWL